jgi:orotidine-5'-phosphate decarboxylase
VSTSFADRLAGLVEERRSQVCLGLDPDPSALSPDAGGDAGGEDAAERAALAVAESCAELIERAGAACVAAKLQLACFERLGAPGWAALGRVAASAREAGLVVIADGKRGDVPVTAAAYAQALVGETPTPWGPVAGLDADAFTANPLLGEDALEPLVAAAAEAGAGIFVLVRTSNPGAGDLLDLDAGGAPLHERIARLVAERSERLRGERGLSGMGAVVGATEPRYLERLRELMPEAILLVPGVGAQGGRASDLGPAFGAHPASVLVSASRSIASAEDPEAAAEALRAEAWSVGSG